MESSTSENQDPEFSAGVDHVMVTFPLRRAGVTKGSTKRGVQKREYRKGSIKLTPRQREVLSLIQENPKITYRAAAEKLSIRLSSVQKHFKSLVEKGAIAHTGPAKGGRWEVRQFSDR